MKIIKAQLKTIKFFPLSKYVNACRTHKPNYYSNLAEKLSKDGGVYKELKRNKIYNDIKIECPESGLLVEDNITIAEIFKNSFVNITSELENNKSKTNLKLILT